MHKSIQIARTGQHTASGGQQISFSEHMLAAAARAYDPARHEAPIVIGHPNHDGPAYGWVERLHYDGALEAFTHQVDPSFAEMVAKGRFKKVSAAFYMPGSPANPVPGVYYLRHVGFLGAQPPAIKGMRAIEFADDEADIVQVEKSAGTWLSECFSVPLARSDFAEHTGAVCLSNEEVVTRARTYMNKVLAAGSTNISFAEAVNAVHAGHQAVSNEGVATRARAYRMKALADGCISISFTEAVDAVRADHQTI